MTTIYHYHPVHGAHLGQGTADPDPMSEGEWLIPAGATTEPPPPTGEGEVAAFVNGGWITTADHRGEIWWADHDTQVTIDFLGDPTTHGLAAAQPPAPDIEPQPEPEPPTLAEAIASKIAELDEYRWEREISGVDFGAGLVRTDPNSQAKIAAAYFSAKTDPEYSVPVWEVQPGSFVALDNASIILMGQAVRAHVQDTFNRKAALHTEIAALVTVEEVQAFDIDAAWATHAPI